MSRFNKCPNGCKVPDPPYNFPHNSKIMDLNKVDENSFMYTCRVCSKSFIYEIPPGFKKCFNCGGWGCLTCDHTGMLTWVDVAKRS